MTDSPAQARYALSFTSGALLRHEAMIAAPLYVHARDWTKVRQLIETDNLLQARTQSSGQRLARETVQRLKVLSDPEIELLVESTASERDQLLWVAVCRRYALIGEFAEEVLREHYLLLTPTLSYEHFDSFIAGKALWHEELAQVEDSTMSKLRANVFRMLVEAGLVSDDGRIVPVALSSRVEDVLAGQIPSDIRFFPTRGEA
jgi:hypothetical protein